MSILSALSSYNENQFIPLLDNAYYSNNSSFSLLGRWQVQGTDVWTGWMGSKVEFSVSGTRQVIVLVKSDVQDSSFVSYCTYTIDQTANTIPVNSGGVPSITINANVGSVVCGRVIIALPNTGIHNIMLWVWGLPALDCFNATSKTWFQGISIPSDATLNTWTQGIKIIQTIGDSWMSIYDWTKYLNHNSYSLYPVVNGGYTVAKADSNYDYDYNGQLNTSDPTADAVIISFGVNDYVGGVSLASFQTSLLSLIDKVRLKQPTPIPIFLVRVPDYVAGSQNYGQYLTSMNNAAGLRTNVSVIDTTSLDVTISWMAGGTHLNNTGQQTLGNFVNAALIAAGL